MRKTISVLLLWLLAVTSYAANPSLNSIRTNVTIYTNIPNTNLVDFTGAGTSAANGVYAFSYNLAGPVAVFTNATPTVYFYEDPNNVNGGGFIYFLSNNAAGVLYATGTTNLGDNWIAVGGTGNGPTASQARTTNNAIGTEVRSLVNTNIEPLNITDTNLYVDPVYGYDVGARGPFTPWRTITNALKGASSGDTIILKPGTHNLSGSWSATNVHIQGGGRDNTFIVMGSGQSSVTLIGSSTIADVDLNGHVQIAGTNNRIDRVRTHGSIDGIIYSAVYSNAQIWNSDFFSFFDTVNDTSGTTNSVADYFNCNFVVTYNASSTVMRGVATQNGKHRIHGGSIVMTAGPVTGSSDYSCVEVYNTNGIVTLNGVSLIYSSPSHAVNYASGSGTNTNSVIFYGPQINQVGTNDVNGGTVTVVSAQPTVSAGTGVTVTRSISSGVTNYAVSTNGGFSFADGTGTVPLASSQTNFVNLYAGGVFTTNTNSAGTSAAGKVIVTNFITGGAGNTNRMYLTTHGVGVPNNTATLLFNISLAANKSLGGTWFAVSLANNGTDYQATTGPANIAAVNKAGTVTVTQSFGITTASAVSSGTLAHTYSAAANGNSVDVKLNSNSSLSSTTNIVYWSLILFTDDPNCTVTLQ